ncbi:hypothetical protein AAHH84_00180 [Candidatus Hodgkinia cicadicola]
MQRVASASGVNGRCSSEVSRLKTKPTCLVGLGTGFASWEQLVWCLVCALIRNCDANQTGV